MVHNNLQNLELTGNLERPKTSGNSQALPLEVREFDLS